MRLRVTRSRRVYIGRHRIHHGAFGLALTVVGAALAWHDRRDWPFPFADLASAGLHPCELDLELDENGAQQIVADR